MTAQRVTAGAYVLAVGVGLCAIAADLWPPRAWGLALTNACVLLMVTVSRTFTKKAHVLFDAKIAKAQSDAAIAQLAHVQFQQVLAAGGTVTSVDFVEPRRAGKGTH